MAVALPLVAAPPASAHESVCERTAYEPVGNYGRFDVRGKAACAVDSHEPWVSVTVTAERKPHWWSSWSQPYPWVNLVRVPTTGGYEGGGKVVNSYGRFSCTGDYWYRTVSKTNVGGIIYYNYSSMTAPC